MRLKPLSKKWENQKILIKIAKAALKTGQPLLLLMDLTMGKHPKTRRSVQFCG
jgi:hypothetical protein